MNAALLKVGDLARRTGMTVRTLHFYDEIGLLKPSGRSDGGHRLYDATDVARLQRIASLRTLGFTLEEIGDLLDGREGAPTSVLRRHIAHLHGQIRRASALAERLEQLAAQLEASAEVEVDDLLKAIEETVMIEKYYTAEQLAELEKRREALGEEGMAKAHQDWADVIAAAKAEMEKGTPPESEAVLAIARRWKALIEAFTGGNPGIQQGLNRLWRENQDAMAQRSGIDPALGAYIGQAMAKLG